MLGRKSPSTLNHGNDLRQNNEPSKQGVIRNNVRFGNPLKEVKISSGEHSGTLNQEGMKILEVVGPQDTNFISDDSKPSGIPLCVKIANERTSELCTRRNIAYAVKCDREKTSQNVEMTPLQSHQNHHVLFSSGSSQNNPKCVPQNLTGMVQSLDQQNACSVGLRQNMERSNIILESAIHPDTRMYMRQSTCSQGSRGPAMFLEKQINGEGHNDIPRSDNIVSRKRSYESMMLQEKQFFEPQNQKKGIIHHHGDLQMPISNPGANVWSKGGLDAAIIASVSNNTSLASEFPQPGRVGNLNSEQGTFELHRGQHETFHLMQTQSRVMSYPQPRKPPLSELRMPQRHPVIHPAPQGIFPMSRNPMTSRPFYIAEPPWLPVQRCPCMEGIYRPPFIRQLSIDNRERMFPLMIKRTEQCHPFPHMFCPNQPRPQFGFQYCQPMPADAAPFLPRHSFQHPQDHPPQTQITYQVEETPYIPEHSERPEMHTPCPSLTAASSSAGALLPFSCLRRPILPPPSSGQSIAWGDEPANLQSSGSAVQPPVGNPDGALAMKWSSEPMARNNIFPQKVHGNNQVSSSERSRRISSTIDFLGPNSASSSPKMVIDFEEPREAA